MDIPYSIPIDGKKISLGPFPFDARSITIVNRTAANATVQEDGGANYFASANTAATYGCGNTTRFLCSVDVAQPVGETVTVIVSSDAKPVSVQQLASLAPAGDPLVNNALVFDQILLAPAAVFDVNPIAGTYRALQVLLYGRGDNVGGNVNVNMEFNGDGAAANYFDQFVIALNAAFANGVSDPSAGTPNPVAQIPCAGSAYAQSFGAAEIIIPNYANALGHKSFVSHFHCISNGPADYRSGNLDGGWKNVAPITRIRLIPTAGNFVAGSRLTVYGLA